MISEIDKKIISLEKDYYIDLHRRGNDVYISVRNRGGNGGQKGAVALQYIVSLEKVLLEIAEDYNERGSCTIN